MEKEIATLTLSGTLAKGLCQQALVILKSGKDYHIGQTMVV